MSTSTVDIATVLQQRLQEIASMGQRQQLEAAMQDRQKAEDLNVVIAQDVEESILTAEKQKQAREMKAAEDTNKVAATFTDPVEKARVGLADVMLAAQAEMRTIEKKENAKFLDDPVYAVTSAFTIQGDREDLDRHLQMADVYKKQIVDANEVIQTSGKTNALLNTAATEIENAAILEQLAMKQRAIVNKARVDAAGVRIDNLQALKQATLQDIGALQSYESFLASKEARAAAAEDRLANREIRKQELEYSKLRLQDQRAKLEEERKLDKSGIKEREFKLRERKLALEESQLDSIETEEAEFLRIVNLDQKARGLGEVNMTAVKLNKKAYEEGFQRGLRLEAGLALEDTPGEAALVVQRSALKTQQAKFLSSLADTSKTALAIGGKAVNPDTLKAQINTELLGRATQDPKDPNKTVIVPGILTTMQENMEDSVAGHENIYKIPDVSTIVSRNDALMGTSLYQDALRHAVEQGDPSSNVEKVLDRAAIAIAKKGMDKQYMANMIEEIKAFYGVGMWINRGLPSPGDADAYEFLGLPSYGKSYKQKGIDVMNDASISLALKKRLYNQKALTLVGTIEALAGAVSNSLENK